MDFLDNLTGYNNLFNEPNNNVLQSSQNSDNNGVWDSLFDFYHSDKLAPLRGKLDDEIYGVEEAKNNYANATQQVPTKSPINQKNILIFGVAIGIYFLLKRK